MQVLFYTDDGVSQKPSTLNILIYIHFLFIKMANIFHMKYHLKNCFARFPY